MEQFQFLKGLSGDFIYLLICTPILLVMTVATLQLYLSRKRKPYSVFSRIMLAHSIVNIMLFLTAFILLVFNIKGALLHTLIHSSQQTLFLLILYGFFRFNNIPTIKDKIYYFSSSAIVFAVGFFSIRLSAILCITALTWLLYKNYKQYASIQSLIASSGLFTLSLLINDIVQYTNPIVAFIGLLVAVASYALFFMIIMSYSLHLIEGSYISSITDPLTGLYNRRMFMRYIHQCLGNSQPIDIIFADIDNFKKLNDTQGHEMGDEALKHVASIFIEETKDIGIAARYGGEEIVALVYDNSISIEILAKRILKRVEKETIVTLSVGYKNYDSEDTPDNLIRHADQAMYSAKKTGKNKVVGYSPLLNILEDKNNEKIIV